MRSKYDTAVRYLFQFILMVKAPRAQAALFMRNFRPVSRARDDEGCLKRACPRAIVLEKKFEPHHKGTPIFQTDGAIRNLSTMKSFAIPVLAALALCLGPAPSLAADATNFVPSNPPEMKPLVNANSPAHQPF